MANTRVMRLFTSKDVSTAASGLTVNTVTNGSVVPFKANDNTQLLATDTVTESNEIFLVQGETGTISSTGAAKGNLVSPSIKGVTVRDYRGEIFKAYRQEIVYVGHKPSNTTTHAAGSGAIVAANSSEYSMLIKFKGQQEILWRASRYNYTSDTSATQLEIATAFVTKINADTAIGAVAVVVGDGTGANGVTGATNYGIQVIFNANLYGSVGLPDVYPTVTNAFSTTPVATDVNYSPGNGNQVQMLDVEFTSQSNMGFKNRIWFPGGDTTAVPTTYIVAQSASALTGTCATTAGDRRVTGTGTFFLTELAVGDAININGTRYSVRTITSDVALALDNPAIDTNAADASTKEEGYDIVVIAHDNTMASARAGETIELAPMQTLVAFPSKLTNASAKTTFLTAMNTWMASTPKQFAPIVL